jgi:hypothetical protein
MEVANSKLLRLLPLSGHNVPTKEFSRSPSDAMTAAPARSKPKYNLMKIYGGAFKPNAKPKFDPIDDGIDSIMIFNQRPKCSKIIVFDLDETIGSFSELFVLWKSIHKIKEFDPENIQKTFNEMLDLYPEFLRHGIVVILEFLLHKKRIGECSQIYIYTNNQCTINSPHDNMQWVQLISQYFNYRLGLAPNEQIFDKIICAFKINNVIINTSRTTNNKTHGDFIRCTILPKNAEICFIDNTYYDKMKHDKVYYIQPKSYYHHLSKSTMMERLMASPLVERFVKHSNNKNNKEEFRLQLDKMIPNYLTEKIDKNEIQIDLLVSQKLMFHIRDFFYMTSRKERTRKMKLRMGKYTKKVRRNP